MQLPECYRPRRAMYKACEPGVDLPAWFLSDLRSIDDDFYPVWHKHQVMWDDIINEYTGPLADPRFIIQSVGSELLWGWPLRDRNGSYALDNAWHIWRLSHPHGWAHIVKIESKEGEYLRLLLNRLDAQNRITQRYGFGRYGAELEHQKVQTGEKQQRAMNDLFLDVQMENKGFMREAKENLLRNHVAPTNPKKETISSYSGQGYRSRLSRPLDDTEGGLVVPDSWKN